MSKNNNRAMVIITYKNNFMVQHHRTVAPANEGSRYFACSCWKDALLLEYCSKILISFSNMFLAGCQVAIQKTERRIVESKPSNNCTLRKT